MSKKKDEFDKRRLDRTAKARAVMLSKRSKYEDVYQYYLINQNKGESIRAIARKFGVDDTGLGNYIKKQKSAQSAPPISHAIEGIKNGLEVIKEMQESAIPRDNQLAQKAIATLEDYYPQMKSVFASIQNRVLNALDKEVALIETKGHLDLREIMIIQDILKKTQDTNYFNQKSPLVAVQNNINNQNANIQGQGANGNGGSEPKQDSNITFEIEFVGKDDKVIEGEVED